MSDVHKGFTLVEMLVIVVLLGILAATVIMAVTDVSDQTRDTALRSDLHIVRSQIEVYMQGHLDTFPSKEGFVEQMTGKTHRDGSAGGDLGPYLLEIPTNPYNNDATVTCRDDDSQLGDGGSGWHYNATTGGFHANDSPEHATW